MEDWETHYLGTESGQNLEETDGPVVFRIGKDKESVEQKLQEYRPSTFQHRIWILNNNLLTKDNINFEGVTHEWGEITANGEEFPIDQGTFHDMAEKYNYKSGEWFFFPQSDDEADCAWDLVSRGMMKEEDLGAIAMAACVEQCGITPGLPETYIICVWNEDYTDESQVFAIEKFLREAGINETLMYKLDIYTHLAIYKANYYSLRPTLYKSIPNERTRIYLNNLRRHSKPPIIGYNMGLNNNGLSVDEWRTQYPPSQLVRFNVDEKVMHIMNKMLHVITSRTYGICRITQNSCDDTIIYKNLIEMLQLWRKHILLESPSHEIIDMLSKDSNVTRGRWYFYEYSGYKVDIFWKFVVNGFANGTFDKVAISAEVMPCNSKQHVIKVYNRDYTNTKEVYQLEKLIRKMGVKCKMMYEPIIYCHLGLYHKKSEEHGLDSTIYTSYYDAFNHESKIHVLRELHVDAYENV